MMTDNVKIKVLVIEDEQVNMDLLIEYLEKENYEVIPAGSGVIGINMLKQHPDTSLILLDRNMPEMNGLELLAKLKTDSSYSGIPVIMQTAVADNASVTEGISAGAYYYLTKPYKKAVLLSIVKAALTDLKYKRQLIEEVTKNHKMMGFINKAWLEFRTMNEAQNLAYFIANSFPDPEKVVLGLSEMMLNAVEHGNLGINYYKKSELMRSGELTEEIEIREKLPENRKKKVVVFFEKTEREICVTIKDEGDGFEWNEFMEMSAHRATDPNGRGILMAKTMSFDEVIYKGTGNEVCCKVSLSGNSENEQ